jgi:type II secretory pathway pseudopilin PulG
VTFTELLVVLAITAILVAVAVPTATNYTERARLSAATSDARSYAQAEDACQAIHGYYVPLQLLDDRPGDSVVNNDADRIGFYTSVRAIDPLIPCIDQQTNQPTITATSANGRVRQMVSGWQGPFIEFRRATNTPNPGTQTAQRDDFPLDPYGQPYRFFSPCGEIGSIGANVVDDPESLDTESDGNGLLTNNNDEYDRYTIVSFGRDTEQDSLLTLQEGDDIVHMFGIVGYETGTSLLPPF